MCLRVLVCILHVWNWGATYCTSQKLPSVVRWIFLVKQCIMVGLPGFNLYCSLWRCFHCFVIKCLFVISHSFHSVFFNLHHHFFRNLLSNILLLTLLVFLCLTLLASPFSLTFSSPSLTLSCHCVQQREGEGLRSMLGLHTQRPAAGWIRVIDQAQSICSARLLGLCGWRLFLNYYRRQMLVRRCSLSRLDCFSAALLSPPLSPALSRFSSSS